MKPAEIKKRARKLAKDGKIVDAIRALETLTSVEVVDPYDLVMMGDLCMRAGRTEDATMSYQRAVEAYRDASLHRNGIALCKKVLRMHADAGHFTLLLAELCEREGLVPDAVDAYLEYAEPLDPEVIKGPQPWLDALAKLSPRNTNLLTRQAELLVRWDRTKEAVELLRTSAGSATADDQRTELTELAAQIAELGGAFEEAEAMLSGEMPAPSFTPGESNATSGTFDQGYLRDLSFEGLDAPPERSPEAAPEAAGTDPGDGRPGEPADDANPSRLMDVSDDLHALRETQPEGDEMIDLDDDTPSLSLSVEMDRIDRPEPPEAAGAGSDGADAASSPRDDAPAVEPAEGLESFGGPIESGSDDGSGAEPTDVDPDLASLRETLEAKLQSNPFDLVALEKLVEVCEEQGDSLSVLDLRERLAHASLQEGRSETALEQFRKILEDDPSRDDVRERYERLSGELGHGAPAPSGVTTPTRLERSGPLFNVRGLSKVEVRDDDTPASEDDMVDLGALLDEFREGLSSSMADASPRAHYDLGLSHMEMGLFEEAVESFQSASEDAELEPVAREMWGRCLRMLERNDESIGVLRAALARRSDSLGIRYQLGLSLETAGETEEALGLFRSISREDPNYEDIEERIASLGGSDCAAQPPESSS